MNVPSFLQRLVPFQRRIETRHLIVNADDFGMNRSVNRGVVAAYERGIVTSASLMVRRDGAAEAAEYGRAHVALSLGLHLDLGEWVWSDGVWQPMYVVVPLGDPAAVADEVARQLDTFRRLVGREPTHLDSHQHVHRDEPLRSIALAAARRLGVPLRHFSRSVHYCGRFYALGRHGVLDEAAISVAGLIDVVADLPVATSELCCHPGDKSDDQYGAARPKELATLCDRRIRRALRHHAVALRSFRGVAPGLDDAAANRS